MAHLFVTRRTDLAAKLLRARGLPGGEWDGVGVVAQEGAEGGGEGGDGRYRGSGAGGGVSLGMVDVKVCAVDETWSGLKLVIRVSEREK